MEAIICENPRDCINMAYDLCERLEEIDANPKIADKRTLPIIVRYFNKNSGYENEYCIMTEIVYRKWCMGRTYYKDGHLYHSGQRISFEKR